MAPSERAKGLALWANDAIAIVMRTYPDLLTIQPFAYCFPPVST